MQLSPAQKKRLTKGVDFVFNLEPVALGLPNEHKRVPRLGWFRLDAELLSRWLTGAATCESLGAHHVAFNLDISHPGSEEDPDFEASFEVYVSQSHVEIYGEPANELSACNSEFIRIDNIVKSLCDTHKQHNNLSDLPNETTLREPQWYGGALLYNELCWPDFMKRVAEHRPDLVANNTARGMSQIIESVESSVAPKRTRRTSL